MGLHAWPTITNCMIINNFADNNGGGLYSSSPDTFHIINCTFSGNEALLYGGGIYCDSVYPMDVTNTILWMNTPTEIYITSTGDFTITYSDIMGGWTGAGNIDSDPLCKGGGDYHLSKGSPCIDTGSSTSAPSTDFEGDSRPLGTGYDMGADEYNPAAEVPIMLRHPASILILILSIIIAIEGSLSRGRDTVIQVHD